MLCKLQQYCPNPKPQSPLSDYIIKQKLQAKLQKGQHISPFHFSPVHCENLQPDVNGLSKATPNVTLIRVKDLQVFPLGLDYDWSMILKVTAECREFGELVSIYIGSIFIHANTASVDIREVESRIIIINLFYLSPSTNIWISVCSSNQATKQSDMLFR